MLAQLATEKKLDENPGQWYPCGFAWVRIRPARGALVEFFKEHDVGYTSEEGGYVVYNPSGNTTQWMDAKMAGARDFAEHLRAAGISAVAESRID